MLVHRAWESVLAGGAVIDHGAPKTKMPTEDSHAREVSQSLSLASLAMIIQHRGLEALESDGPGFIS